MNGVALTELHCPTCGKAYGLPLRVEREEEPDYYLAFGQRTILGPPRPPWIECPAGHKWTLKTLYRREGEPDAVLLGDYVGGGCW